MQFKHPELLWALLLLLIPIFIHLFQLRKFKKTPFTNVKLLQKVVIESRKSNQLKKWLLLCSRLLMLAAIVLAFAQPFFANETALQEKETVVYLDNSFSMQAKTNGTTLLEEAIQELVKSIPEGNTFSLFTNNQVYKDVVLKEVQNNLLSVTPISQQLDWNAILLKANTLFSKEESSIKNLVVVSDFQQREDALSDSLQTIQTHLVQKRVLELQNIVIDTAYVGKAQDNIVEIHAGLSSTAKLETTPVSLYNNDTLIAKTSAKFTNNVAEVIFSIPNNEIINGKIEITDVGLAYDNKLFFNINQKEKIKVIGITSNASNYLERIFTEDEFQYQSFTLKNLNYSLLESQNMIVLNGLKTIPNPLITALKTYRENGGSLLIIPHEEIETSTYNQLLLNLGAGSIPEKINVEQKVTTINFSHPLYTNVFYKKVNNFQYPTVKQHYGLRTNLSKILSYGNGQGFLVGGDGLFLFTASINTENSNFTGSPLIVPTLYNMGVRSLKLPELYQTIAKITNIDTPIDLGSDNILQLYKEGYSFIPQQRSHANKTTLTFSENPKENGIYVIKKEEVALQNISFNYARNESKLGYQNLENNPKYNSIAELFNTLEKNNSINELWKWFVILALFFILMEVLILKFFK